MGENQALRAQFDRLLSWERGKKRERMLAVALFYALATSFVFDAVGGLVFSWQAPPYLPLGFFLFLAPALLWINRWRDRESTRAVGRADRALKLDERALTAWELVARDRVSPAENLVVHEAWRALERVDIQETFRRTCPWQAVAALVLVVVWGGAVWLGSEGPLGGRGPSSGGDSVAHRLKDFALRMRELAEDQKLAKTLDVARDLEEAATARLKAKTGDTELKERLSQVMGDIGRVKDSLSQEPEFDLGGYTRQQLVDLKAELGAWRQSPSRDSAGKGRGIGGLGGFRRLENEARKRFESADNADAGQLKDWLDKLAGALANELDRRALSEVEEFVEMLAPEDDRGAASRNARLNAVPSGADDAEKKSEKSAEKGASQGQRPGSDAEGSVGAPLAKGDDLKRLPGDIRQGKGASLTFRTEAKGQKAKTPPREITASYRLAMEEEVASERIPPELKETIKRYFLSLGDE